MAEGSYWQCVIASRPQGMVTEDDFRVEHFPASEVQRELEEGELLVKLVFISVDPYMRGRMNDKKSYVAPFELGKPGMGGATGVVVKSNDPGFSVGDHVLGHFIWRQFVIVKSNSVTKLPVPDESGISPSLFLGALGLTGLSAYIPLLKLGKPKSGDVVFISGAAGAVGSVVGQIAKSLGCKVYGSVGSASKLELVRNLGFDDAFNYKEVSSLENGLKSILGDKEIDIFFDNVGGELLEATLNHMKLNGRVICCGQISQYNADVYGVKNLFNVVIKRLTMSGFIISDWISEWGQATLELTELYKKGKLLSKETVIHGHENIPKAFIGLFKGDNIGKMIVKVSDW